MGKNLQDLRREAGYKNSKDFAAAIGVPASTYSRYEGQPDAIPIRQAWAIADFLGCPIDAVVGREQAGDDWARGDVQRFYDGISDEGRRLMDDFMAYVAHRERELARRTRQRDGARYDAFLLRHLASFDELAGDAFGFGVTGGEPTEPRRESFERYLKEKAATELASDVDTHLAGLAEELRGGYLDYDGNHIPIPEEEIARQLDEERESLMSKYGQRNGEVIDGIMRAYDERYGKPRQEWVSFLKGRG